MIVAGRKLASAKAYCARYGGTPAELDTNGDLDVAFEDLQPEIIVDAAGPFQLYGADDTGSGKQTRYRVAEAALRCGAHYLDLADDADFVANIGDLDEAAKAVGRAVISGCSSVPTISAAAVTELSHDLETIESIESVILPGNRAPRGRAVMEAILAQLGKPTDVCRDGEWREAHGWCQMQRQRPEIDETRRLGTRLASPIGAPDLKIFPGHFDARTVRFMAGLELTAMHTSLAALAWIVRWRWLSSARPLVSILLPLANLLKPFGTDRGAMTVAVIGRTKDAQGRVAEHRQWTLIAEAGDGPEIPPTPAFAMVLKLVREADTVPAGARPCVTDLTLAEIETALSPFKIKTAIVEKLATPMFEQTLGGNFERLSGPLRALHDVLDVRSFEGRASVERGGSAGARWVGWMMGFPPAGADVPVRVEMQRTPNGETWTREFGSTRFRSYLAIKRFQALGTIWERFGLLSFKINLEAGEQGLRYPVVAGRLLGVVPLPAWLLPTSDTLEYVTDAGHAAFDVTLSHPWTGFVVRYRGSLAPVVPHGIAGDTEIIPTSST